MQKLLFKFTTIGKRKFRLFHTLRVECTNND